MSKSCECCGARMRQDQIDCEYCTPPEAITPIVPTDKAVETRSGLQVSTFIRLLISFCLLVIYILLACYLGTALSTMSETLFVAIYGIQTIICFAQFIIYLKPVSRSTLLCAAIWLSCSISWSLGIPMFLGLISSVIYLSLIHILQIASGLLLVALVINFIIFLLKTSRKK